jgi:hypothetical protein
MAYENDNIVVNTKPRAKKSAGEETGNGSVSFVIERDGIERAYCIGWSGQSENRECRFENLSKHIEYHV